MNSRTLLITGILTTLIVLIQCPLYSQTDIALSNNIETVIAAYADAREASNPDKIRQLFTTDADQLVSSGHWRHGIEQLVGGMLQSSQNNPGQRTLTVETIRPITHDVVMADARYEIKRIDDSERKMWSTFILKKEGDRWKIAAIRNMLPAQ